MAAKQCRVARFIGFDIDEGYLEEARVNVGLTFKLKG